MTYRIACVSIPSGDHLKHSTGASGHSKRHRWYILNKTSWPSRAAGVVEPKHNPFTQSKTRRPHRARSAYYPKEISRKFSGNNLVVLMKSQISILKKQAGYTERGHLAILVQLKMSNRTSWLSWKKKLDSLNRTPRSSWTKPFDILTQTSWTSWTIPFDILTQTDWTFWTKPFYILTKTSWTSWTKPAKQLVKDELAMLADNT